MSVEPQPKIEIGQGFFVLRFASLSGLAALLPHDPRSLGGFRTTFTLYQAIGKFAHHLKMDANNVP